MTKTRIEWADETWNPVQDKIKGKSGRGYHCTKVSPGCDNCYAERTNALRGNGLPFDGRATAFELVTKTLEAPLHWKKPRRVFVQSMGDLFHEQVPFSLIDRVFMIMATAKQHTYILLTKRPERMLADIQNIADQAEIPLSNLVPPENVWLGVTAENQEMADMRIPVLLQIPAAVRFVSVEPMLGPVDVADHLPFKGREMDSYHGEWRNVDRKGIDWIICGGESGPKARPMHPDWVRALRDQCMACETPFFFKHWGEWITAEHFSVDVDLPEKCLLDADVRVYFKVGKNKAGRILDGREWNEFPEV